MEKTWLQLQNGLQTYCQTNGFKQIILGLSGGIDSAVTAVLAADVMGGNNVTAVMMKTQYTSTLSLKIAHEIAQLNNLNYQELDIECLVQNEINFLKHFFQAEIKSIVIENLQARIRGQLLMALSNQTGGLVLASGNKSEALTGYCTLYGDTCGGLAPLGNLYKTTIFELAKWRNKLNLVLPVDVINRAPSAELAFNQKDENTLPPYLILDQILSRLVDKKQTVQEIIAAGFKKDIIQKVISLVEKSAFKRLQMAKALDVDIQKV